MKEALDILAKLKAEHAKAFNDASPLRAKKEALEAKLMPLQAEYKEVSGKLKELETVLMGDLRKKIDALEEAFVPKKAPEEKLAVPPKNYSLKAEATQISTDDLIKPATKEVL